MSVWQAGGITVVKCDGVECKADVAGPGTKSQLRKIAKTEGWTREGQTDLCPKCKR
jgi:hypothetical protein